MRPFRLTNHPPDCTFFFDGHPVAALAGEPVAVALFLDGKRLAAHSSKYHRPRSFFCLAGNCASCLMRIGGQPNMRSCRVPVTPGLRVERQNAFPSGSFDILGATDFIFSHGMNHHTIMTNPRVLNLVLQKVVRRLGGSGLLPEKDSTTVELHDERRRRADVAIIGGGPAGLEAALAIKRARPQAQVLLIDEGARMGGSLLSEPTSPPSGGEPGSEASWTGLEAADALAAEATRLGVELHQATALAWYPEDDGGTLAVLEQGEILRVQAARYLYATGANDVNQLFANNDRPGIMAARAVGRLLVQHGVVAGAQPIILGNNAYAIHLHAALTNAGAQARLVDNTKESPLCAYGKSWVHHLGVVSVENNSKKERIACDLIAVAATPSPVAELPREHGVSVIFDEARGGFVCQAAADGLTNVKNVYVCGDVTGFLGVAGCRAAGAKVGAAIAKTL